MRVRDLAAVLADAAHARGDRAVRPAPAQDEQRRAVRSSTSSSGRRPRCPRPCARAADHQVVVVGSYETLPVTSAFSRPPIRCSSPACRDRPRPRERLRVAQVRHERRLRVRLRRERREMSGSVASRAAATAPSRSRGSVREQENRASGTSPRSAQPRSRRRSTGRRRRATTGTGDSELRPYMTMSRSACSAWSASPSTGRRAGCRGSAAAARA
jgi:hypothetical protein